MAKKTSETDALDALFAEALTAVARVKTEDLPQSKLDQDSPFEIEIVFDDDSNEADIHRESVEENPEDVGVEIDLEFEEEPVPEVEAEEDWAGLLDEKDALLDETHTKYRKVRRIATRQKKEIKELEKHVQTHKMELLQHRSMVQRLKEKIEREEARGEYRITALSTANQRIESLETVLRDTTSRLERQQVVHGRSTEESAKYGASKVVLKLLPTLDNIERALIHASADLPTLLDGLQLIRAQFLQVLGKLSVQPVDVSPGVLFDPNYHEALKRVERSDIPEGTIVEVLLQGYLLHDRLLRAASVSVAQPAPQTPQDQAPIEALETDPEPIEDPHEEAVDPTV